MAELIVLKRHLLKALYFVVVYLVVEIYLVILNSKKPTIWVLIYKADIEIFDYAIAAPFILPAGTDTIIKCTLAN